MLTKRSTSKWVCMHAGSSRKGNKVLLEQRQSLCKCLLYLRSPLKWTGDNTVKVERCTDCRWWTNNSGMHFSVLFRIGRIFVYNFIESDVVHLLWHSVYNWDLASSWVWQKENSQDDIIHEDTEAYTHEHLAVFWPFSFDAFVLLFVPFSRFHSQWSKSGGAQFILLGFDGNVSALNTQWNYTFLFCYVRDTVLPLYGTEKCSVILLMDAELPGSSY